MKTILQIIPALGTGGAEQSCVDVAVALVARGDRAIVVSNGGRRVEELKKAGAKHIRMSAHSKNPLKIMNNAFELAHLIREEKVDIVHARSRAPAWSAYLACKMTGCPYMTTFHAAYGFSCRIKKAYNRVMVAGERVIAISDYIVHHLRTQYHITDDKIRLVNRGTDMELFKRDAISERRSELLRKSWRLRKEELAIILPARLSPIKGHEVIIEALALLKKEGVVLPPVLFIGDDQGRTAYRKGLEDKIKQENLEDSIRLVGACTDMAAAYSLACLTLAPSQKPEGFGRIPVESMALGVPVIASSLGAMAYTVLDGTTGWLVPADDPPVWALRIKEALSLNEKARAKMAIAARKHVEGQYSLEQMIQKTLSVYDEL